MTLKTELDQARNNIKTDSYPISIRELVLLYKDGELDIHPEFQRFLRWTIKQKTNFIESILLGIPIPSIFVFQRDDGVLDVVDGLQRISTILQFMGELKDEEEKLMPPLTLEAAQYLPSLKDKVWDLENPNTVGPEIQKFFRQEKIDIKFLLRDSDSQAKYELFQRVNTGGTPLSDQEVRNCILIMINSEAFREFEELSKNEDFQTACPIPEKALMERYDLEIVLRFLILRSIPIDDVKEIGDLGQFLTTQMRLEFAREEFSLEKDRDLFNRTFCILREAADDSSLRRYDPNKKRFVGPFLISAFEMVALGVAYNIDLVEEYGAEWLREKICGAWSDERTQGIYGQGVSTARRLPKTLEFGRNFFSEA
ncbi:MAG: DUF262 domain-containing protein [Marivibrio sp.]|uniref:DUF262 domain-containing protein n=1 Tax=Marivibrio sp. TaxID=2039719 RepID=UPI0032EBA31C